MTAYQIPNRSQPFESYHSIVSSTITGSSLVSGSALYGASAKITNITGSEGTITTFYATYISGSTISGSLSGTLSGDIDVTNITGSELSCDDIYGTSGSITNVSATNVTGSELSSTSILGTYVSGSTFTGSTLHLEGDDDWVTGSAVRITGGIVLDELKKASATITKNDIVTYSTTDYVSGSTGDEQDVVGVAAEGVSSGSYVPLLMLGVREFTAVGSINEGQYVSVHGTSGAQYVATTGSTWIGKVVGTALETVTDGETLRVLVSPK